MAPLGGGGVDIRSLLGQILNVAKSKAGYTCTAPCDGFVLKMHYRWTFFVFLGGFFSVWYSWYHSSIITCVSHFNADTQVRMDYVNICLSYPFIEKEDFTRRYILFYRWIHWSFLLIAGFYYIPRKISKQFENPKLKKLIEELSAHSVMYKVEDESQIVDKVVKYMQSHSRTHNGLYLKFLSLNFVALLIDMFALGYFDFLLQGRFFTYGFKAYPYERDPIHFTDYMSNMFPPFVSCELEKANQLTAKRTERLGCHLTFMELYEKIFLFLWFWLIILLTVTTAYILFLFLMLIPCFRKYFLKFAKPLHTSENLSATIDGVSQNCKIGDIYILYRFKQHLSHVMFHELMVKLSNPTLTRGYIHEAQLMSEKNKPVDNMRNRKNPRQMQHQNNPQVYPDCQQYINTSGMTCLPPHMQQEAQHRLPNSKKNTSILIE